MKRTIITLAILAAFALGVPSVTAAEPARAQAEGTSITTVQYRTGRGHRRSFRRYRCPNVRRYHYRRRPFYRYRQYRPYYGPHYRSYYDGLGRYFDSWIR
jgi:hypothetical protein